MSADRHATWPENVIFQTCIAAHLPAQSIQTQPAQTGFRKPLCKPSNSNSRPSTSPSATCSNSPGLLTVAAEAKPWSQRVKYASMASPKAANRKNSRRTNRGMLRLPYRSHGAVSMALKATVFKADLQIADMDRHYYQTHALTLARHPSETDERMMVRLLAFLPCTPAMRWPSAKGCHR